MGMAEPADAAGQLEAGAAALMSTPECDLLAWAAHVLERRMDLEGCAERYGRAMVGFGARRGGALVHCLEGSCALPGEALVGRSGSTDAGAFAHQSQIKRRIGCRSMQTDG